MANRTRCPDCGATTNSATALRPRLCSDCGRARRRASRAEWDAKNPGATAAAIRKWKQTHREEIRASGRIDFQRAFTCLDCGSPFRRPGGRGPLPGYCADCRECRRAAASYRSNARRRAVLIGATAERVDRVAVFERDNWTCQGCARTLTTDAPWPSPNCPSLDHIIPLSRGGAHTYANTQLLCLRCNLQKGNRVEAAVA